jgi:hypothetical protein
VGGWSEAIFINGPHNNINSNIFKNDRWGDGIRLSGRYNKIHGNIIDEFATGILLEFDAGFNQICNNEIKNNLIVGILVNQNDGFDTIKNNNFLNNKNHGNAYFYNAHHINWEGNYWDDWNGTGPYRIKGEKYIDNYPYGGYWERDYNYDYSPAEEPNEIIAPYSYDINSFSNEHIENRVSANNIEKEEDCDCQTAVSDVNLNRLDKVTEIKELSNRISELRGNIFENFTICAILLIRYFINVEISLFFWVSSDMFPPGGILYSIFWGLWKLFDSRADDIYRLYEYYECWWT